MASTLTEYAARKLAIHKHLGSVCKICDTTEDLQVDHVDHASKSFTVMSSWAISWDRLMSELQKCQLLCKSCHLSKSVAEGSLAKGWTSQPRQTHGTVWSYSKYKCRCTLCKEAKAASSKHKIQGVV